MSDVTSFVSLDALASTLALPPGWLREQADAGRIPCLKIKARRMFSVSAVRQALAELARKKERHHEVEAIGAWRPLCHRPIDELQYGLAEAIRVHGNKSETARRYRVAIDALRDLGVIVDEPAAPEGGDDGE